MSRRGRTAGSSLVAIAIALTLLVGCVSNRGIAEFSGYQSAFDKTNATANAILDQLALQERALFRTGIPHVVQNFDPDEAGFYTDAGDPPSTAAFRGSLATVDNYNDLLFALASGQSASSMVTKLGELQVNLGKAAGSIGSLAGYGAEGAAVGVALNQAFAVLRPAVDLALKYRSRQAFRVFLAQNYQQVRIVLVELRGSTPVMFRVLTAPIMQRHRTDITSSGLSADERKKIEGYRKLLSDWVVLIDATIVALDQVNGSLSQAPTLTSVVAGLNSVAIDLTTASDAARKDLASLAVQ